MTLLIAQAVIGAVVAPFIIWLTTRGAKHLNRPTAWIMAAITFLLAFQYLLQVLGSGTVTSDTALLLRALVLAAAGICCASLLSYLYRTRDQVSPSI